MHLEDPSRVVGVHPAVEEELRQSEVDHAVVLPDDRLHRVVHQRLVLVGQVKEHPLQNGRTVGTSSDPVLSQHGDESYPEVHVEAPRRHHGIADQRVVDPDVVIHFAPHRDRLQHGVHVNQSSVVQRRADLRRKRTSSEPEDQVRARARSCSEHPTKPKPGSGSGCDQNWDRIREWTHLLVEEESHPGGQKSGQEVIHFPENRSSWLGHVLAWQLLPVIDQ